MAYGLGEPTVGPKGFKAFYRNLRDQFADVKVTVDRSITQDKYTTALCSVTATYRNTGTPVSFTGTSVARIEDGSY